MHSNFVFTQTNFELLKDPLEAKRRVGSAPHWLIKNRVCWHYGNPQYIIHNEYLVETVPDKYKDYFHILNPKKPLYAMTHYSATDLKTMARQLGVSDTGTRVELYARITDKVTKSL
jgi:hypothetical protein